MPNDTKLKPCPFCGNEFPTEICADSSWFIRCSQSDSEHYCGVSTDTFPTFEEAEIAWNTRWAAPQGHEGLQIATPIASDITGLVHDRDLHEFQRLVKIGYRAQDIFGVLVIVDPFAPVPFRFTDRTPAATEGENG